MLSAEYGVKIIYYLFIESQKLILIHNGPNWTFFAMYFTGIGLSFT